MSEYICCGEDATIEGVFCQTCYDRLVDAYDASQREIGREIIAERRAVHEAEHEGSFETCQHPDCVEAQEIREVMLGGQGVAMTKSEGAKEFTVFIPTLPPTTNHAYTIAVNKRGKAYTYMTAEGKAWKAGAQLKVQAANDQPEGFWKGKRLYVTLIFFDKSTLTYDVDGRVKLALDAVADGLGFDDRYVYPLLLDKRVGTPGVSVLVLDLGQILGEPLSSPDDRYFVGGQWEAEAPEM